MKREYQITDEDVKVLREMGYLKKDIYEIEKKYLCINYSVKDLKKKSGWKCFSLEKVLPLINREEWLSGIGRAVFHSTASRELKDGTQVLFEMSL